MSGMKILPFSDYVRDLPEPASLIKLQNALSHFPHNSFLSGIVQLKSQVQDSLPPEYMTLPAPHLSLSVVHFSSPILNSSLDFVTPPSGLFSGATKFGLS